MTYDLVDLVTESLLQFLNDLKIVNKCSGESKGPGLLTT